MGTTILLSRFARGNKWTRLSFLASRFARGKWLSEFSFLAFRSARDSLWTSFSYLEGTGGPDFRMRPKLYGLSDF